jgi:hypothetical protein
MISVMRRMTGLIAGKCWLDWPLWWRPQRWAGVAWGASARETRLAQGTVSSPATVASADGSGVAVMLRDPHLDALMAAHRQFGGPSALQNSSGFLRNATFDMPLSRGSGQ